MNNNVHITFKNPLNSIDLEFARLQKIEFIQIIKSEVIGHADYATVFVLDKDGKEEYGFSIWFERDEKEAITEGTRFKVLEVIIGNSENLAQLQISIM